jgi:hypothetical protein
MDVRWKFQRLGQDELEPVAVGDPDPAPRYGQGVSDVPVRVG